ncbi:helix-turn-helix transcriptional regulator [Streptomyces sp. NPDC007095]|uniref:helix-turn-helix domain-containing protein n=1 Tax=Streptomyces sp. NPDC007095 TaxID=3154482 RepID=UPI000C6FEB1E
MAEDVALHSSIGKVLRDHQKRMNLTQVEMAAQLGISQPYLSRILQGKRSAVSLKLWNKILEIVPRPELLVADSAMSSVSDAYDRALIALGRGNHSTAEILLGQILVRGDASSAAAMDLTAKAKFHLAGILRDRNRLGGSDGAVTLYTSALAYYRRMEVRYRTEEVTFMLGACKEMSGASKTALGTYRGLLKNADPKNRVLVVRANGRIGALATKLGELQEADVHLRIATEGSVHLDDSYPYSYYHEKLAILRTRQGRLEEANASLRSARDEIEKGDRLREVQSLCVEANMYAASGDALSASDLLRKALVTARTYDYAHQASYINRLLASLAEDPKPVSGEKS